MDISRAHLSLTRGDAPAASAAPLASIMYPHLQSFNRHNVVPRRRAGTLQATPSNLPEPLVALDELLQAAQPHFGTRALEQAVTSARNGTNLPAFTPPSITPPSSMQFNPPSLPDTSAFSGAAQSALNTVLDTLRSQSTPQAWDLPATTTADPHFGTRAASDALQQAADALQRAATGNDALNAAAEALGSLQAAVASAVSLPAPVAAAVEQLAEAAQALARTAEHAVALPAAPWADGGVQRASDAVLKAAASLQANGIGGYDLTTVGCIAAVVLAAVAASAPSAARDPPGGPPAGPALPSVYDSNTVTAYWNARPLQVASRAATVGREVASFLVALARDKVQGTLAVNSPQRAAQLRTAIERLGPAYVKVAQALSTRVDLLDEAYLREIESLQDRVPPFDTALALTEMEAAFQAPVSSVVASLSAAPVAAASLGQVYFATLSPALGSQQVAIKVRRPRVLESVSLDLHLMRRVALALRDVPEVSTDWVSLIDEWSARFFDEMDYRLEAANAKDFKAQIEPLCEGIVVPDVVEGLSNESVLVTSWIEGEKLSESTADDVRTLCNTLLNCYLIQLLQTRLLHSDPHPGNLIRTPDGKIAILDYGLMTVMSPEQSLALTEYIAHLSVQDWEAVANDLVALGFIPAGVDPRDARIIEPLGQILEQLSKGGGATGINIDVVTVELNKLSKQYPIQIPPYFVLILRAFSVIEGIALRVDPQYAIVRECFPYLSRRLLTDDHPRSREALRQLLYGDKRHIDIGRLTRIVNGFSTFTVAGLRAPEDRRLLDSTAREALRVLFSPRGSYVQTLLVEELATAVDVLSREALNELARRLLGSVAAVTEQRAREALGPLRPLVIPLPTPFELLSSLAPAVELTEDDREALDTIREALALLQQVLGSAVGAPGAEPGPLAPASLTQLRDAARELQPLLPELLPGVVATVELFIRALLRRFLLRLAEEVGPAQRGVVEGVAAGMVAAMPLASQVEVLMAMMSNEGTRRRSW